MKKLMVAMGMVALAVIAGGCSSSTSVTPNQGKPMGSVSTCSSPQTLYVFPGGATGAGINPPGGSAYWLRLALATHSTNRHAVQKDQLVEAVIPSDAAWTVRDVTFSPNDGKKISQFWRNTKDSVAKVLSAEVCFQSWSKASLLKLSVVTGSKAERAQHVARGMFAAGPSVLKPGETLFVAVYAGSSDGWVYRTTQSNAHLAWYAVNVKVAKIYPVSLAHFMSTGNIDIYEFQLPKSMLTGTYQLMPLAEAPASGGMAMDGNFSFRVE